MNQRKAGVDMRSNDARIAVLETTILNINSTLLEMRQDFRHYAERIDTKIDTLDKKVNDKFEILDKKIDTKFETLDKKIDTKFEILDKKIDTKFEILDKKIDTKFDTLDKKIDSLDAKFDKKFDSLNNRIWTNFLWLMGMIIGVAGLVAHALHCIGFNY